MAKFNILVIPSDKSGCGKFRSIDPHIYLEEMYPELFHVEIKYLEDIQFKVDTLPSFLEKYDLVHVHKQLDPNGVLIQIIKYLGKKVIVDIDDHYTLSPTHPLYQKSRTENWGTRIVKHLRYADYITTTTEYFKKELLKHNKNIEVFPNAINPDEKQFIPQEQKSDKLRVGIICGSSHLEDLKLLNGMISQFSKEELDKLQFVLCGFDTRGNKILIDPNTKQQRVVPINPMETCWYQYEKILTNNYSSISEDYKKFLHLFAPNAQYPNVENQPYKRCWTKSVNEYATHYNNIDVLLVPLVNNQFNRAKSQLKVVEAGFFHKAIIASNVHPYTIDLKSAVDKGSINLEGNSLLVDESKNNKNWSKYIKLLLNNRELLSTLQNNLYETVKTKYNLKTVTEKRKDFYLKILES